MFYVFVCVTTCVLFVTAVYVTIFFQKAVFGVEILWQILWVSFLCSIANIFYPQREVSKKTMMFFVHWSLYSDKCDCFRVRLLV